MKISFDFNSKPSKSIVSVITKDGITTIVGGRSIGKTWQLKKWLSQQSKKENRK